MNKLECESTGLKLLLHGLFLSGILSKWHDDIPMVFWVPLGALCLVLLFLGYGMWMFPVEA